MGEWTLRHGSPQNSTDHWISYDTTIVWAMTDDLDFVQRADKPSGPLFESLLADWAVLPDGGMKELRSAELAEKALLEAVKAGAVAARGLPIERPNPRPEVISASEWKGLRFRSDEDGVTFAVASSPDDQPRWIDLQFRTEDVIRHLRLPIITGRPLRLRNAEEQATDQAAYAVKLAERLKEVSTEPDAPPADDGADLLAEKEWTLPMALAWAASRSVTAVREHWCGPDGGPRRGPFTYDDVDLSIAYDETVYDVAPEMPLAEAWAALVTHLRNGRLAATDRADGAEMSTLFWRGVSPSELPDVLLNREDVMREFPAGAVTIKGEAKQRTAPGQIASTISPPAIGGRPSKYDWLTYDRMFRERVGRDGPPDPLNIEDWQTTSDVARWLQSLAEAENPPVEMDFDSARKRARKLVGKNSA